MPGGDSRRCLRDFSVMPYDFPPYVGVEKGGLPFFCQSEKMTDQLNVQLTLLQVVLAEIFSVLAF